MSPPGVAAKGGWRDDAVRFIKGEWVTNRGRVRSDNIVSQQHRGLLIRSKSRNSLICSTYQGSVGSCSSCRVRRISKAYNRLEPDFVVVFKGLTFFVEVDGDTYHKELPAEADKRLVPLTYEGVEVRRIRASDLGSDGAADLAVRELIDFMAKRGEAR